MSEYEPEVPEHEPLEDEQEPRGDDPATAERARVREGDAPTDEPASGLTGRGDLTDR